MAMTLEMSFHGVERSPALEGRIGERAAKLSEIHSDLTHCRVVVRAPHGSHRRGGLFEVHIDAHYPGGEAVITRSHRNQAGHSDPAVAVRDAFIALRHHLQHARAPQAV